MAELFASGRLVDLILILTAIEAVCLVLYWRSRGGGVSPMDLLPNLFAGAFLLLALRLALGGAGWELCCGSLAAAGVAHCVDLSRRWRG
ncbi:MAG: hypothetical protein ABI561_06960 [Bradyrhizobium sp.]